MNQMTVNQPTTDGNIGFGDIDYAKMQSFKNKGFNPSCIFDVGGSDGSWTRKILPLFPQADFYLFEPLADIAESYAEVSSFVSGNAQTTLFKVAVGKENGNLTFNHRKESPASSTAINVGNKDLYEQLTVPLVTLDSIIATTGPVPNMIKVDIQGGELNVLKGVVSNLCNVELLLLETWLGRGYAGNTPLVSELISFLTPFGFHMFDVGDSWRNENGSLISQDFFFVNERSSLASDFVF